jgi:pyrroloquinoline quinone biosynthesis protein E
MRERTSSTPRHWRACFPNADELGVLQVHLSAGEPGARRDLVDITASAPCGRPLHQSYHLRGRITDKTFGALAEARLDHVQILIQDSDAGSAEHIAGYDGSLPASGSRPRSWTQAPPSR